MDVRHHDPLFGWAPVFFFFLSLGLATRAPGQEQLAQHARGRPEGFGEQHGCFPGLHVRSHIKLWGW